MKNPPTLSTQARRFAGLLFILLGIHSPAFGALHIWTGTVNQSWANAGNWATNGVPTSGESGGTTVFFSSNTTSTMDIAGLVVDFIQFSNTGNTINGSVTLGVNGATVTTNIQTDQGTGTNTIACPLKFTSTASIYAVLTSGSLTFSGNLSSVAGSNGIILDKGTSGTGGTFTFSGTTNSYTGKTLLKYGTLQLNSNGSSTAIPGELDIGQSSGTAGSAVVRLLQGSEIADAALVMVNTTGSLDTNDKGETIGALTVNSGGSVTMGTSGSGLLVVSGATSVTDGSISIGASTLQCSSTLSMTGGSITSTTGSLKLGGTVSAVSSATSGAVISIGAGGTLSLNATNRTFNISTGPIQPELTVTSVVSDGSVVPSGIFKSGTGTLALRGFQNYTYTGTTTVDKGVIDLNTTVGNIIKGPVVIGNGADPAGSAILRDHIQSNDIAPTAAMTINASGVFDLANEQETVASLSGTGPVLMGIGGRLTVGDGSTFTYSGTLNGNGGTFTKVGSGTMTFAGTLAMSGAFVVDDGTLALNAATGQGAPTSVTIGDGTGAIGSAVLKLLKPNQIPDTATISIAVDGTLDLNDFAETVSSVTLTSGTIDLGGGTLSLGSLNTTGGNVTSTSGGTLSLSGTVTATSSATNGATITAAVVLNSPSRTFQVNAGPIHPELTISGLVSNGNVAQGGLFKDGTGSLSLLGGIANTFSGTTTVNKGFLLLNNAAGYAIVGPLVIGNAIDPAGSAFVREANSDDISNNIAVQINASGELDVSTHSDHLATVTGTGVISGANSLTVGVQNDSFTFDGKVSGTGNFHFIKSGTGTLTLTGPDSGTNLDTQVQGGKLVVTGGLASAGTLEVSNGATLAGSGTVGAVTTVTGASVAPGLSTPGVLSGGGNLNFTNGGTFNARVGAAENDSFFDAGTLTATGGTLALNVIGTPIQNAYVLASYASLTGTFASVTGLPAGYTLNYSYFDGVTSNHIALVVPGTVITGAASGITAGSATLAGTINPAGKTMSWYFRYGTSTAYTGTSAVTPGISGSTAKAVSATISGLAGGQLYHYQLVAFNNGGAIYGADQTFSTSGPNTTTLNAQQLNAVSATVSGQINPLGLNTTAWFEYGLTTAYGLKTPAQSIGNGVTTVTISAHLTGLLPGKYYHYRVVAMNSGGTSHGLDKVFATAIVDPPQVVAGQQPLSQIVAVGQVTSLYVGAMEGSPIPTDAPLTYQWRRNGIAIAGAKAPLYILPPATVAMAGTYTCQISNAAGSISSGAAELGVVDQAPKNVSVAFGSPATLTVTAAGNNLLYQWYKDSVLVPLATSSKLTIPAVQSSNDGTYLCSVRNIGGLLFSGPVKVAGFSTAPVILTPVVIPPAIVGGTVSFQVPVDPSPNLAPSSYTVTGLPLGLTTNASTGLISGRITAPLTVDKTYTLTMKAANSHGTSATVSTSLFVHVFPAGVAGTYSGLVNRDALPLASPNINGGLGGGISLTITSLGSYTGKLALGIASYPLSGVFIAMPGSSVVTATPAVLVPGLQQKLQLSLFVDGTTRILSGSITDSVATTTTVNLSGAVNPWNATTNKNPLAATYTAQVKIQNAALVGTDPSSMPPGNTANVVYPQGSSYATVTLSAAGAVTWVGKMADGSAPPAVYATTIDASGHFPVHLMLNNGNGSAHGTVTASPDNSNVNNHLPLLDGTLDWSKNADNAQAYGAGIPLFSLTVAGGKYVAPAANTPVLDMTSTSFGTPNSRLVFTEGGLKGPPPIIATATVFATELAGRSLRITSANAADFVSTGANPAAITLTLVPSTGTMSGSFTLVDGGVTRKVSYTGLLVPRLNLNKGVGFFLLTELPTSTSAPILSGQVILQTGP